MLDKTSSKASLSLSNASSERRPNKGLMLKAQNQAKLRKQLAARAEHRMSEYLKETKTL